MAFKIKSLSDFISAIKNPLQDIKSLDYGYFYRGCATHDWKYNLIPGIYRYDNIFKEETHFKEMILRSPNDFYSDKTTLEKLVKMQHYALPTRLLDVTANPLVALYFASGQFNNEITDGKVYLLKIKKDAIKYYDSDAVSLISNLAKLRLDKTDFSEGFDYLIHEIKDEKPYYSNKFSHLNIEDIKSVFPVKVKLNNNRIVKQSGAFLIFGIHTIHSKEWPALLKKDTIAEEFLIDKDFKQEIRNSLDALSINETTLFPELEHQANYLSR